MQKLNKPIIEATRDSQRHLWKYFSNLRELVSILTEAKYYYYYYYFIKKT